MKMENECGIYKIVNKVNGKIYVGQTSNIKKRCKAHLVKLKNEKHCNSYLQNAWNKYGEKNVIFESIEICNVDDLNNREIFWIKKMDSFENGYNLTLGGEGNRGYVVPTESREKMSKAKKGKQYRLGCTNTEESKSKLSASQMGNKYCLGRIYSDQTKAKLSLASKNKSMEAKEKLSKASVEKNSKKVFSAEQIFNTTRDCAEHFKINIGTMRNYLSGNNKMPQRLLKYNLHYLNKEREEVEKIV